MNVDYPGLLVSTQWAAVNTQFGAISEPPQKWLPLDAETNETWCGCTSVFVTVPPTILDNELAEGKQTRVTFNQCKYYICDKYS